MENNSTKIAKQKDIGFSVADLVKDANEKFTAKVVSHKDILQEILDDIKTIEDFHSIAEVDADTKLTQSFLAVIVVDAVLDSAKRFNLGLCRNNDFFYTYNGSFWKQTEKQAIKDFLARAAFKLGVKQILTKSFEFKEKLFKQFCESAYLPRPETQSDKVLINLQNGTFEISGEDVNLREHTQNDFLTLILRNARKALQELLLSRYLLAK
jgi:putative DNA primase/helicase